MGCGGGGVLRLVPKAPARDSEVLAWVWVFFYRSTPNTSALGLVLLVSGPPFWAPESQLMPCSDAPWSSALSSALLLACVAWPRGRSCHQCRAGGKPPSTHHHGGRVILGMLPMWGPSYKHPRQGVRLRVSSFTTCWEVSFLQRKILFLQ